MKASQLLISTIAAASVVGAIGLANAQSNGSATTPVPQGQQVDRSTNTTVPDATRDSATLNNATPSADTMQRNAELPAQADRN